MKDPVKALAKRERRKLRIDTERKAQLREERERAAYRSAQVTGTDNPIRISEIPYSRLIPTNE